MLNNTKNRFIVAGSALVAAAALILAIQASAAVKTEVQGILRVVHEDNFRQRTSEFSAFIEKADKSRVPIEIDADSKEEKEETLASLPSGAKVEVTGRLENGELQLKAKDPEMQVRQAVPTTSVSSKKVAVILYTFTNSPKPVATVDQVRKMVFTGPLSPAKFWKENSFDQISLVGRKRVDGDIFGWYSVNMPNESCDENQWEWEQRAEQSANLEGFKRSDYDHVIFASDQAIDCSGEGYGDSIGKVSWLNLVTDNDRDLGQQMGFSHELGHNFGFWHANALRCRTSTNKPIPYSGRCTSNEYMDEYDVMGLGGLFHTNASNKLRAGWFTNRSVRTITTTGEYRVVPIEKAGGIRLLRIPRYYDSTYKLGLSYHIEYRRPLGFDGKDYRWMSKDHPRRFDGIFVRLAPDWDPQRPEEYSKTHLIDMTASTSYPEDALLKVNQAYTDPNPNVGIAMRTLRVDADGAVVRIRFYKKSYQRPTVPLWFFN